MGRTAKTCIVICGPTAVGKTSLSLELAEYFNTSILSFDSRQCYRELNIGVAKPSVDELSKATHYFINSHTITDEVTAAGFAKLADAAAEEVFSQSDTLIAVGGTGLYLDAFARGMDDIPPIDEKIRESLRTRYSREGINWLKDALAAADSSYSQVSNPQRMLRALEVKLSTGRNIESYYQNKEVLGKYKFIRIGLDLPRAELYERINRRVDQMMEAGLEYEAQGLIAYRQFNALNTVGYKELFAWFDAGSTRDQAIALIKQNTRRYAKRQLTWFRKDSETRWFSPDQALEIRTYCDSRISEDKGISEFP